jgi:serine/threonine-protein kinase
MDPQRWQRIEEIYHAALPLATGQRAAYVSRACEGDAALLQQVESLLEADDSSGEFLETAIFDVGLRVLASDGQSKSEEIDEARTQRALTGTRLDGRYRIDRKLGHGGVGVVYLAHDEKLHNKPVVVKVLLEKSQANKWFIQKFQQEKEALARVDHPGVVGILDAGELAEGDPYIVMQFVDGVSLREALKEEPEGLDLQRVASIVKQVGSALGAVHEKKIYHRDLKPENIMLQRLVRGEEQVKILDFGVAKVRESLIAPSTATGAVSAGTVLYMSPEQLRGGRISAASDVYALGLIAYEMITGRRPFKPDTVAQLSDMQREGVRVRPVDLRPRLPAKAQEIILRALTFDPAARYQNAAELGEDFAHALMNEDEDTLRFTQQTQVDVSLAPPPLDVVRAQPADTIQTPFAPVQPSAVVTEQSIGSPVGTSPTNESLWPKLAVALAALVVLVLGGYLLVANRERLFGKAATAEPLHSLTYSLTVQKMRDGKRYEEPFQSSGQEVFESGYQFRLNVASAQSGYLYVFNEGADANGAISFTIIYPTPATNGGSAKVGANESITTNWNTFGGKAGTEQFWMIWSQSSASLLEAARDAAFSSNGRVADAAMVRTVKEFLTSHSDPKIETTKDTARQETRVRGNGDVLVKLVELEHR